MMHNSKPTLSVEDGYVDATTFKMVQKEDDGGQRIAKPGLRLLRHFRLASLPAIVVILFVAGLGLWFILRDFAIDAAEHTAIHISSALSDNEMRQFIRPNRDGEQKLSIPPEELPKLDQRMRALLASFDVVKIKIYNYEGQILYSTDSNIIGMVDSGNSRLATALRGLPVSKHESKDTFGDLEGEQRYNVEIVETYVPIRGLDGRIIGSFEIYKDITNHLAMADRTLIRAGAVLSVTVLSVFATLSFVIHRATQTINTGTAALQQSKEKYRLLNRELEATVEKLTLSNRELSDFAHVAAHDLKAPLRAIGTLADWISTDYSDMFDEQGREKIRLLVARAKRMSEHIDSILRYSELGHVVQKEEEVNLNTLVREVITDIAPPENIEIDIACELPNIRCQRKHMAQVFENLLSNAVKYMDKPKGRIKVGCVEEDGFWKFSVTDNGPGIEEKYFEKIFQVFQTLVPRDEIEATGIGLAVVKKIARFYRGKTWVESKPGEGSTFFFTLPKQESEVEYDERVEANIVS